MGNPHTDHMFKMDGFERRRVRHGPLKRSVSVVAHEASSRRDRPCCSATLVQSDVLKARDAAMSHPEPIGFRAHRLLAPQSHVIRAAALLDLLDREEVLLERVRLIGEGSDRQRREIEAELSEIRRDLERLGFPRKLAR